MTTMAALQAEINLYGFDAAAYNNRIIAWYNEGTDEVSRILDIPDLIINFDVTANVATNASSTGNSLAGFNDTDRIISTHCLTPGFERELEYLSMEDFLSLSPTRTGPPEYATFGIFGGTSFGMKVYPFPDQGYLIRIRYLQQPTDQPLSGGAELVPFQRFTAVMKAYILAEAYAAEDDMQASQFWRARWREKLTSWGESLQNTDVRGPRQVKGAWG